MKTTKQFLLEALTTGVLKYWSDEKQCNPSLQMWDHLKNVQSVEREAGAGRTFNVHYSIPGEYVNIQVRKSLFVTLID